MVKASNSIQSICPALSEGPKESSKSESAALPISSSGSSQTRSFEMHAKSQYRPPHSCFETASRRNSSNVSRIGPPVSSQAHHDVPSKPRRAPTVSKCSNERSRRDSEYDRKPMLAPRSERSRRPLRMRCALRVDMPRSACLLRRLHTRLHLELVRPPLPTASWV